MRFRQHQGVAQARTIQLMLWFGVLVVALTVAINLLLALLYKVVMPAGIGFPNLFFETNTAMVLLFVCSFCTKERKKFTEDEYKVPLKTSLKAIFKNKYL